MTTTKAAGEPVMVPMAMVRSHFSNFLYENEDGLKNAVEGKKTTFHRSENATRATSKRVHALMLLLGIMMIAASICTYSTGYWKWGTGLMVPAIPLLVFDRYGLPAIRATSIEKEKQKVCAEIKMLGRNNTRGDWQVNLYDAMKHEVQIAMGVNSESLREQGYVIVFGDDEAEIYSLFIRLEEDKQKAFIDYLENNRPASGADKTEKETYQWVVWSMRRACRNHCTATAAFPQERALFEGYTTRLESISAATT